MTDLSITAANVVASTNARKVTGTSGATITAGLACYFDATAGTWEIADCTAAATATDVAIALVAASSGQPITLVKEDPDLDLGVTLVVGTIYVLSETGGIAPHGDLASGDFPVVLGVAEAADSLNCKIIEGATVVPA